MPTKSKLQFILNQGSENEIIVIYISNPGKENQVTVVYPNHKIGGKSASSSYYRLWHYEFALKDLEDIVNSGEDDDTGKPISDSERARYEETLRTEKLALKIIKAFECQ